MALNAGRKRRLGFGRKGKNSFTVHRSEEVLPEDVRQHLVKQGSSVSSDGEGSQDGDRLAQIRSRPPLPPAQETERRECRIFGRIVVSVERLANYIVD
jgi:hypothetical protein